MSDYIVSARKYRPDSFESLIGQDNIAQTLKNSVLRGQLAHAYLFCGPRGVGKTSTARIFAKTINCSNPGPELEPCGHCESCESFQEGRSYCIYELDAASNNSVDDIKTLMEKVQIPPQVGKYSVYIIDEVHMLSQAAFNAFLKTLEEPPSYAIFILCTTEKHKVLPTILSRCQTYDFNRIGVADIVSNLKAIAAKEGITVDSRSLHVIARKADGAMRDALTIFDQTVAFCGNDIKYADVERNLGILDSEYGFRLVDAFLAKDYASSLLILDEVLRAGFNALHFITALGEHVRDLLVARTGGLEALVEMPEDLAAQYREQGSRCSVKFLYDALGVISECEAGYKAAVNQRLHIEYAIMRLAFLGGVPAQPSALGKGQPGVPQGELQSALPDPKGQPAAGPSGGDPSAANATSASTKAPVAPAGGASAVIAGDDRQSPEPAKPKKATHAATSKFTSLLNTEPEKKAEEVKPVVEDAGVIPDEAAVKKAWVEMVSEIADGKPRLRVALIDAPLEVSAEGETCLIGFEVLSQTQKTWIENEILKRMVALLCAKLHYLKINVSISVKPMEELPKRAYKPEEQAQELMESNPDVRELVRELSLDAK